MYSVLQKAKKANLDVRLETAFCIGQPKIVDASL